jgi:hypothetical protein
MPRTHAQVTQQEVEVFQQFANENGLKLEGADGEHNGNLFHQVVVVQQNQDITPGSLAAAVAALRDQLRWFTPLEKEHQALWSTLTPAEQDVISNWFKRQKLVQEGEQFIDNWNNVVSWLVNRRSRPITSSGLDVALNNILNGSQRKLHFQSEPKRTEGYGRRSGRKFESWTKTEDREYVGGRRNWAKVDNPALRTEVSKSAKEAQWKQRAEDASNAANVHSRKAQLRALFVTDRNGNVDWEQTTLKREALARSF